MGTPTENVAKLKEAYRQWHETKGGSVKVWLDMMADNVKVRSLAAGAPTVEFTAEINSKEQFKRYFDGLLADWQMINYKTGRFIAEGEHVAMLGSTAWRNRKTGREVDTPKADFWMFRDGKIVEFYEPMIRQRWRRRPRLRGTLRVDPGGWLAWSLRCWPGGTAPRTPSPPHPLTSTKRQDRRARAKRLVA